MNHTKQKNISFPQNTTDIDFQILSNNQEKDSCKSQKQLWKNYQSYTTEKKEIYLDMVKFSCLSCFLTFLGVSITLSSSSPWNLGISSLYYTGTLLSISPIPYMLIDLKRNRIKRKKIKMTLDNWEHKHKFELYDRMILNKKLERLNRKKPTYIRRSKKYALVRNYREQYPKTR